MIFMYFYMMKMIRVLNSQILKRSPITKVKFKEFLDFGVSMQELVLRKFNYSNQDPLF